MKIHMRTLALSVCLGGFLPIAIGADGGEDPRDAEIRHLRAQVRMLESKTAKLTDKLTAMRAGRSQPSSKSVASQPVVEAKVSQEAAWSPKERDFRRAMAGQRKKRLQKLRQEIVKAQKDVKKHRRTVYGKVRPGPTPEQTRLRRLRDDLRLLRNSKQPFLSRFDDPLEVGQVAKVLTLKVVQIQNSTNFLGKVPVWYAYQIVGKGVGPITLHYAESTKDVLVWITGVDTAGMVDDQNAKIDRVLGVVGTRQYGTVVGGSKTVFVLEPISSILGVVK